MTGELELDDMREIMADFLVEAQELVQSLDTNLNRLEAYPHDPELLNQIFRAAHTIKGVSSFLNFEKVTSLTHGLEEVLNRLRKGDLVVTPNIVDVLFRALDMLKVLLDDIREGTGESRDISELLSTLASIDTLPVSPQKQTIPVPPADYIEEPHADPHHVDAKKGSHDQTIRVDVERLDALMNLLGELVLSRNSLVQATSTLEHHQVGTKTVDSINGAVKSVNFITNELQTAVMKMRMQPVGRLFGRYPRLVRDLCRESGKQVELLISGESTELDRSIIEEIADPLVHILRNACHHGIEMPDVRVARGKPPKGTIKLSAAHAGGHVTIRVEDDGNGLDINAIRAKVIERNLLNRNEATALSERDLFKFILEPGFTTAKAVTNISGRGVGMDVVRTNVERLNGQIELESVANIGTTITLQIPLTLAIMQGLLIETGREVYVLPLSSVHEMVRTDATKISYLNRKPTLLLRNEIIPVVQLEKLLLDNLVSGIEVNTGYIAVVNVAERRLGIAVDRFLGQEEVVVKPLGNYLGQTKGIAGATILGDGRVRMIIDLLQLHELAVTAQ